MRVLVVGILSLIVICLPQGFLVPKVLSVIKPLRRSRNTVDEISAKYNKDLLDVDLNDLMRA